VNAKGLKSCSSCLPFTQLSLMCGPEVRLGDLRPCQVLPPYSYPSSKVPKAPSTGWGCGILLYLPVRAIRWSYLQALLPLHNLLPSCSPSSVTHRALHSPSPWHPNDLSVCGPHAATVLRAFAAVYNLSEDLDKQA
jgi:hypothetical protein